MLYGLFSKMHAEQAPIWFWIVPSPKKSSPVFVAICDSNEIVKSCKINPMCPKSAFHFTFSQALVWYAANYVGNELRGSLL